LIDSRKDWGQSCKHVHAQLSYRHGDGFQRVLTRVRGKNKEKYDKKDKNAKNCVIR
jgi:hypothetical protein